MYRETERKREREKETERLHQNNRIRGGLRMRVEERFGNTVEMHDRPCFSRELEKKTYYTPLAIANSLE